MSTGCPRAPVHDAALQLLQLLDQRFFGNVGPLPATEPEISKFIKFACSFQSSNEKITLYIILIYYFNNVFNFNDNYILNYYILFYI